MNISRVLYLMLVMICVTGCRSNGDAVVTGSDGFRLVIQLVIHSSSVWEHHSSHNSNDSRNDHTTTTSRVQVNRQWELLEFHRCTRISFQGHRCQATCHGTTTLRPRLSQSSQMVSPLPLVDLLSRRHSLHLMKMHLVLRTKGLPVSLELEAQAISVRLIKHMMVSSTPMIVLSSTLQFTRFPHRGNQTTRRKKI